MKILVSGSSGRVGRMVVARLLERGDHVRGFDMRASGRSHDRYEEVVSTLDDTDAAARAVVSGVRGG